MQGVQSSGVAVSPSWVFQSAPFASIVLSNSFVRPRVCRTPIRIERPSLVWISKRRRFVLRNNLAGIQRGAIKKLRSRVSCTSNIDISQSVYSSELLKEKDLDKWHAAMEPLLGLGFSEEEADAFLGKAFGWTHTPYWGEGKAKVMADCNTVVKILDFLRELGLSNSDLLIVLKKFPEVLGCKLEEELRSNALILNRTWGISGNSLQRLLLRNPKVLGYNVDCRGDCMAQCTRCWVRF
eukprot:c23032_g1_i3 orf=125-838(+)